MRKKTFLIFAVSIFSFSAAGQTPTPTVAPIPESLTPPAVRIVDAGAMTPKDVAALEAALQKNPKDLENRKNLVEYYSRQDSKNEEAKKSVLRHRLLLIRHFPENRFYTELGFWTSPSERDNPEFVEMKNEYLRQVALHKDNADVRLSAVGFLEEVDAETVEKLLLEGRSIDPQNDDFFAKLIAFYSAWAEKSGKRFDEGDKAITEADIDRINAKLIAEGEKKLDVLAKDEEEKTGVQRFELLLKLGRVALEMNDTKKARIFAEALLRDYTKDEPDAGDNQAIFYGNNLMGRIYLREGNLAKAKEHLAKSLTLYIGDDWDISEPELDLAGELLIKGEKQAVIDYLQKSETFITNQNVRKIYRNWQRLLKRNLAPFEISEYD